MPYLDRLLEKKQEKDITNAEISELTGIPLSTVTKFFNGATANPPFDTFVKISTALGVSLDEIAGLRREDETIIAPVETAMSNYAALLTEKEQRLKEKDEMIKMLKELSDYDRRQKMRLLWFIGAFVTMIVLALAIVLILDATNANWGYFRY